jgi:L-lactate permease|tara:strand:+ start:2149 stop:2406 length:258 start_codon:yes stop_codon:yes gene_type:complete
VQYLLALLPLLLFVVLLVGLRQQAATAGLWGAALSLAVAIGAFDYSLGAAGLLGPFAEVLKRTQPVCMLYAGFGGLILFVVGQAL